MVFCSAKRTDLGTQIYPLLAERPGVNHLTSLSPICKMLPIIFVFLTSRVAWKSLEKWDVKTLFTEKVLYVFVFLTHLWYRKSLRKQSTVADLIDDRSVIALWPTHFIPTTHSRHFSAQPGSMGKSQKETDQRNSSGPSQGPVHEMVPCALLFCYVCWCPVSKTITDR